jgi:serine/threonine-protein kinase TTK/MPS1
MLEAVHAIHQQKIVHSDLKPANFILVQGALKLIDFGIAKAIPNDTTNIQRDIQIGTLNYMSPEAIKDSQAGQHGGREMMKVSINALLKYSQCVFVLTDLGCYSLVDRVMYGR